MARWPSYAQKQVMWGAVDYVPSSPQRRAHESTARCLMACGGERAGKSKFAAMEVHACIPWCKNVGVVGQKFDHARPEFDYIIAGLRATNNLEFASEPTRGQQIARTQTECTVKTLSVQEGVSELTGTGQSYDLLILAEMGLHRYDSFLSARGRVAEARGRVLLVGTLLDSIGWASDIWRALAGPNKYGGERFSLPSWSNLAVYPGGEDDPEIQALRDSLPEAEFDRRVAALLRPSPARIYPEFDPLKHIGEYPYNPDLPVTLWVDPGYYPSAYCVLAVQFYPAPLERLPRSHPDYVPFQDMPGWPEVRIIDEVYEHYKVHADIVDICQSRPWWDRVEGGVIDVAAKQHQAQKSAEEVWAELTGFWLRNRRVGKQDGIMRVHTFLVDPATREPRIGVDLNCSETIREFGALKRKTDVRGKVISELPDEADKTVGHAMDCTAYGLYDRYGPVDRKPRKLAAKRQRLHKRMTRG